MRQQHDVSVGNATAWRAAETGGEGMPIEFAADAKQALTPLARFRVPVGGQEIELQQVDYAHGGISLLRLRIREGRRFTIFDLDPVTARHWGELFSRWAQTQTQQPAAGANLEKT